MKKIGLFGGTFDPVHNGHIEIAKSFLSSNFIDELWILLTPFPPHKSAEFNVTYSCRYEMLKCAFRDINCSILTIENELSTPSYTFRTIKHLKTEFPDHKFFFCMGEDSLEKFDTWRHYERILEEADLLVAQRPKTDHNNVLPEILEKTHFVNHEPIEISSSEIKARINDPGFLSKNLPDKVISIIEKENLYR